jgi:hypothetical protein
LVFQYMIHRRSHKENDSSKSKNAKDQSQEKNYEEAMHIEDTQRLDVEIEMLQVVLHLVMRKRSKVVG